MNNNKTSINFVPLHLWPRTASQLHCLTVNHAAVRPPEMLLNSRSDWWSLDWSGAEHHWDCCQQKEKPSLCLWSRNGLML